MVSRRCPASKSTVSTNQGAVIPRAAANNWLVITPSTHQLAIRPVRVVAPPRQPSQPSACGFVDGGRTPQRRAFRPPAAHNSTGSATTINLPINELYPLEFQKRHFWQPGGKVFHAIGPGELFA